MTFSHKSDQTDHQHWITLDDTREEKEMLEAIIKSFNASNNPGVSNYVSLSTSHFNDV